MKYIKLIPRLINIILVLVIMFQIVVGPHIIFTPSERVILLFVILGGGFRMKISGKHKDKTKQANQ